jgi:hypothetical protein
MVRGVEQQLKCGAFQLDRGGLRGVLGVAGDLTDCPDVQRRLRHDRGGQGHGRGQCPPILDDVADYAHLACGHGIHRLVGEHHAQGAGTAGALHRPAQPSGTRDETDPNLGLAEPRGRARDDEIAGHRQLASATQRVPLHSGEHGGAELVEHREYLAGFAHQMIGGCERRHLGNIGARDECIVVAG